MDFSWAEYEWNKRAILPIWQVDQLVKTHSVKMAAFANLTNLISPSRPFWALERAAA